MILKSLHPHQTKEAKAETGKVEFLKALKSPTDAPHSH